MYIRKSTFEDLEFILDAIDYSRTLMRNSGNFVQWTNGYPSEVFMRSAILKQENYVIVENNEVIATFCFSLEKDPNYAVIEQGSWLNEEAYGVIHRLAKRKEISGIAAYCFEWCFAQIGNVRLDTHESNIPMQKVLERLNFIKCGIIYVSDGTPRLAYHKIKA